MTNHKWIPFTRGVTFPVFILCLIFDLISCQYQGSTALAAQPPQGNASSVTPHGSTAPSPTEALTRARAKQIALANNPSLDSALERINQAMEAVAQARAGYLPTLSAASGINYPTQSQVPERACTRPGYLPPRCCLTDFPGNIQTWLRITVKKRAGRPCWMPGEFCPGLWPKRF